MKLKSKLILAAIASTLSMAAVAAQDMYVGVSTGTSSVSIDSGDQTGKLKGPSTKIMGGYQINQQLAAETSYNKLQGFKLSAGDGSAEITSTAATLSLVGKLPTSVKGVSVFGRAGVAYTEVEVNSAKADKTDLYMGAGLDYSLTPNVVVRTEWEHFRNFGGGGDNANQFSLGMTYKF